MDGWSGLINELEIIFWRRCMDRSEDASLRWPFFSVVGGFIFPICVFGTMNGFEYLLFFFPITLSIGAVCLLAIVEASAVAGVAARRRAWKRSLSAAILPLSVGLGVWNFGALWEIWRYAGDRLYFKSQKPAYLEMIGNQDASKGARFMVFPGGGWSGVAGRVYIFDESDEILLDDKLRSADFKRRMETTELSCNAVAFPLGEHFYKAFITC